ncbi:PoNe immunity protein domain-containing protein [Flavobacterium sp. JP2137]|uniref:PoNe immunity protein domain-containing protein n=1 Tax=Flavobacterium sp. JP2137 TaxID=3414510 RepID=UPI003D2F9FD0
MENFRQFIKDEEGIIKHLNEGIAIKRVGPERIPTIRLAIFKSALNKTVAHYSVGDSKAIITQSLLDAITAFEEGFVWEGFAHSYAMYDQMVWMLALGILCEISDGNFKRITTVIQRDAANDLLLTALVQYRQPDFTAGQGYIQKTPYSHLDPLVRQVDKSTAFIQYYLDKKWYHGHRDVYWHDCHKNKEVNTYFGYWAWEVAALVKILQIDDTALQDQKYYPYSALHW